MNIRSIKQFIKLDWRKVAITLILFLIIGHSIIFTFTYCSTLYIEELDVFLRCVWFTFYNWNEIYGDENSRLIIQALIQLLIYCYLFSCLLISIWNKRKYKK